MKFYDDLELDSQPDSASYAVYGALVAVALFVTAVMLWAAIPEKPSANVAPPSASSIELPRLSGT